MEAKAIQNLIENMKPTFIFAFVLFTTLAASPLARAQAVLKTTTLGKSQNDGGDLANSLAPGPVKYGKGEKKSQISAAELKSKTIKDSTFGGSLLNVGIDSSVPKLDESKLRNAPAEPEKQAAALKQKAAATEKESTAAKQPATAEKQPDTSIEPAESQAVFSSLSTTATLADNLARVEADAAAAPSESNTSAKATTSVGTPKKNQEGATTDKSATAKPDGDH
jgi:hypothetical protein